MSTTGKCNEESYLDPSQSRLWPDDTIKYHMYPALPSSSCMPGGEETSAQLTKLALECNRVITNLSGDHVWHYSPCALHGLLKDEPPHLTGKTCFRDNIQDEWLIVYLMFRLSEEFKDSVLSVEDGDGQFLLIEAAHDLEKWMKPSEMRNRIFIHGGNLHIISKPTTPAHMGLLPITTPTIATAVNLIRNESVDTLASKAIQDSIALRLECFKGVGLESLLHCCHCYLPSLAAYVLSKNHQLLSAACHALIDRTPSDMQACRKMENFSPNKYETVKSDVMFTRFLYAQLMNLRFSAPRNVGFSMPSSGSGQYKEFDMGMKLTCGLEILLNQAKSSKHYKEHLQPEAHPKWKDYLRNLKDKDYFQYEIEGSKLYQEKMALAKEFFLQQSQSKEDMDDPLLTAGLNIASILREDEFIESEMQTRENNLRPSEDDGWMNITEKDLAVMMERKMTCDSSKNTPAPEAQAPLVDTSADLQSMVFGVNSFIDKVSSHTGAEFPWSGDDPSNSRAITFDPDSFVDTVKSMLSDVGDVDSASEDYDSDDYDSDDNSSVEETGEDATEREDEKGRESFNTLMKLMDDEISSTAVDQSFEKVKDGETMPDQAQSVDVDFNLVKNLLDSFLSQEGGAGPSSNLLHSLGLNIPHQDSN